MSRRLTASATVALILIQTIESLTFTVATASLPAIAAEAVATRELEASNAPSRGGTWAQITGHVTRADAGRRRLSLLSLRSNPCLPLAAG